MRPLTAREMQVLQGLWDGLQYKEIADRLAVSVSRVEAIAAHARLRLGARTTIELMRKALQQGVLTYE